MMKKRDKFDCPLVFLNNKGVLHQNMFRMFFLGSGFTIRAKFDYLYNPVLTIRNMALWLWGKGNEN